MFHKFLCLVLLLTGMNLYAAPFPVADLGDLSTLKDWRGLQQVNGKAVLNLPGDAVFDYVPNRDEEADWRNWYGIRLDVNLPDDRTVSLGITLRAQQREKMQDAATAHVALTGAGAHTVILPWTQFTKTDIAQFYWPRVQNIIISGKFDDMAKGSIELVNAQLVHGETIWLSTPVKGLSVAAGKNATYPVTVANCTDQTQAVSLTFEHSGFDAMIPTVEPQTLQLPPRGSATAMVHVQVPSRIPAGGLETQTLIAIANGVACQAAQLKLTTVSRREHPYILHTQEGWDVIRQNVMKYDWAKQARDEYVARAEKWNVPGVRNPKDPKRGDWLFHTQSEHDFMAAGIAYQLTGETKYAQKVRQFMLNLSNPENGFPVTRRACNQASVQEGHFFQHIAQAYDMTVPSGLYTDADQQQIKQTFHLFVGPEEQIGGHISNWVVSYLGGQLFCALNLQDLSAANACLFNKGGIIDQFVQGTLDDGWWYEVSISYNIWCATEFSQFAIAMRPWGMDLVHQSYPSAFRSNNVTLPEDEEYGMSKAQWGPIHHNSINIKRMWDALPPMLDWRGYIFGLNDSSSKPVAGPQMDIAYYLYRDPAYVPVIKRGGKRELLYAVPELPDGGPDMSGTSTYADNAGVALLRSKTDNRPLREQIQAVLHYGDHGYYHGHFDRTNLLHLSRYGRSFFNPEFIWYGYPNYMYKFYTQTSVSKNMVVVDQKMQEPTESHRLLFHSGKMMQAAVVQTNTRWSNPPYGGMIYWDQHHNSFADKAFSEGRSVPIPDSPPAYGDVTGYTESILQRRLMLVTDDYVVLADYLRGEKEHTFDSLLQMKEFSVLQASEKKLVHHTGQWNPDPVGSAQFVTDCDWYEVTAPARGSYAFRFGPGADNAGTLGEPGVDGVLNMDVHTLWPPKQQIMIGTPPETHPVARQVSYTIRGDGKTLAEGRSGIWILGQVDIDVPVVGVKSLELHIQSGGRPTLFLAHAAIQTQDGKHFKLSQLPVTYENIRQPQTQGMDYFGGPIKIQGIATPNAIPAQPDNDKQPATIRIDLSNIKAARLTCILGGDYPLGDETQRRKTVAQRIVGKQARFLTVIEPFESTRAVVRADAVSADKLRVELTDGRVQEIQLDNMEDDGQAINATITEFRDGKVIRHETTGISRDMP